MATVSKALVAGGDTMELPMPGEEGVYISAQYGSKGADGITAATGTVTIEGCNNAGALGGGDWVPIGLTSAGGGALPTMNGANLAWAYAPYNRIRARLSVVGGAQGVMVSLTSKIST